MATYGDYKEKQISKTIIYIYIYDYTNMEHIQNASTHMLKKGIRIYIRIYIYI